MHCERRTHLLCDTFANRNTNYCVKQCMNFDIKFGAMYEKTIATTVTMFMFLCQCIGRTFGIILLYSVSGHDEVIKWKYFRVTALCEGNPPLPGYFPSERTVTRNFRVFFDLRLNYRLSKQSRRRWFATPSRSLLCHCKITIKSA